MTFHAPQIIWMLCIIGYLCILSRYHGKELTTKINFFWAFARVIIGLALLYWGGFFG